MSYSPLAEESQSTDGLIETIVSEIAVREGTSPEDLTPTLYEVVDPDALEHLCRPTARGSRSATVVFPFHGYTVRVTGGGDVEITAGDQ